MYSCAAKRLVLGLVTLVAVLTLIFFLVRIVPGDPARGILGDQATPQAIEALRSRLGLDQPLLEQYFLFLRGAATLDFGESMVSGVPVLSLITQVLPWTLELSGAALVLACVTGHSSRRLGETVSSTTSLG
ncbi:ABC-type dipeptide/oligopeptide/nickel transport system permease component [Bradyrhizobium sp. GM7.3]